MRSMMKKMAKLNKNPQALQSMMQSGRFGK
jgi:hypothetical protein